MGQYHTIEIELHQTYTLHKNNWEPLHIERIDESIDISKKAEIMCIVLEEGLAHVCLVTNCMTLTKARIEKRFPKKNQENYQKIKLKFFHDIYDAIVKYCDFTVIKCLLIGSPGYWGEDLVKYLIRTSIDDNNAQSNKSGNNNTFNNSNNSSIYKNREKILSCYASNGHKMAIDELLSSAECQRTLSHVKAISDVKVLNDFHALLDSDSTKICIGLKDVQYANEHIAIDVLLITDVLLNSNDFEKRKIYVTLVDNVRSYNGKANS